MNIKQEILMLLNHYAKVYLVEVKTELLANQIIRTLNILQQ